VSKLRAASASLMVANAAAQGGDWVTAEQGTLDAQERTARILRELALKLTPTSVLPVPRRRTSDDWCLKSTALPHQRPS
jgi:hypothetical protein